jgi:hypothetical protein
MSRDYITTDHCAPCAAKNKKNKDWNSCYSKSALILMAESWNKEHPHEKPIAYKGKTHAQIGEQIKKKLYSVCHNNEKCWSDQEFVKKMKNSEIKYYTFKPDYPKEWYENKYTWLNTYDILYVMKQFQKKHRDFVFLGPIPSDCPTRVQCQLSHFDLKKMEKNKVRRVGIIYNLDVSSGEGTHWVAIYIDIVKKEINYYDSYGNKPTPLIHEFIVGVILNFRENNSEPTLVYNDKRHQFGGSECGMYSIHFLLERLNGQSMKQMSTKKITDTQMNDLRRVLFNYQKKE